MNPCRQPVVLEPGLARSAARRPLRRRADRIQFGRGPARYDAPVAPRFALNDDVRLFATTFAAGFIFVSLLIA